MSSQAITLIPIRFHTALNRKPNFQSLELRGIVEEEENTSKSNKKRSPCLSLFFFSRGSRMFNYQKTLKNVE